MTDKKATEKFMDYVIKRGLQSIQFDNQTKKSDKTKLFKKVILDYFNGLTMAQACKKNHVPYYEVTGWIETDNHIYKGLFPIKGRFKYSHVKFMYLNYDNHRSKYYHVLPPLVVKYIDKHGLHMKDPVLRKTMTMFS